MIATLLTREQFGVLVAVSTVFAFWIFRHWLDRRRARRRLLQQRRLGLARYMTSLAGEKSRKGR
jgi:hypothetical protein